MPPLSPARRPPSPPRPLPPTAIWATLDGAAQTTTLAQISRMVRALIRPAPAAPCTALRTPPVSEEAARDAGVVEDLR